MAESDVTAWIRRSLTKEVVLAFLLGVLVGLVVLGWGLWPVRWTDADPADLREIHKASYLQTIADSYALTADAEAAHARLEALMVPGEDDSSLAAQLQTLVKARLDAGRADEALRLQGLASAVILPPIPTPAPTDAQPATTTSSGLQRAIGTAFFLILLGAGVLLLLTQLQKREAIRRRRVPSTAGPLGATEEAEPGVATAPSERSLGQFETAYAIGDPEYDVSTSVHSPSGEFIGEYGVSALEEVLLEAGGISGFEVWLFDKDDVRTETKVLLSELAFADAAFREKVAHKGELLRAQPGQVLSLETANLHLDATITDLEYADDAKAAFAKLTAKLEVSAS